MSVLGRSSSILGIDREGTEEDQKALEEEIGRSGRLVYRLRLAATTTFWDDE